MSNFNESNNLVKTYHLLGTMLTVGNIKNAQNEVSTVMC